MPPPSPVPTDRLEAFRRSFPRFFEGGRILELGAGSGRLAQLLIADGVPFDEYVLSELPRSRIVELESRFDDPRVSVLQLDANDIPTDLPPFDAVVLVALIEHLIDPITALTRVGQLLKPGGFAWIDTPNIAKYTRRLRLLAGRFPSTSGRNEGLTTFEGTPVDLLNEGHFHYFTYRSLATMLTERCGFSSVERVPYNNGHRLVTRRIDHSLAERWPTLFAEVCVIARR